MKGNSNKSKDILCSWIKRTFSVKMALLPKVIYRFDANLIKIPKGILHRNTSQKLYYKVIVIKHSMILAHTHKKK